MLTSHDRLDCQHLTAPAILYSSSKHRACVPVLLQQTVHQSRYYHIDRTSGEISSASRWGSEIFIIALLGGMNYLHNQNTYYYTTDTSTIISSSTSIRYNPCAGDAAATNASTIIIM